VVTAICGSVPPMKGTSFCLTLEPVRVVDFCCVWGWCSLKHEMEARWQVGTRSVVPFGSMCQLSPLSVGSLWVKVYQSVLFISILRSKIVCANKKRSNRSTTRLDAMLRDVRAVRKRGKSTRSTAKNFRIHFYILAIYCNRVRQTGVKAPHKHRHWTQGSFNIFNTRSSIWVDDGASLCKICKTLHSKCQAFERETSSSFARQTQFALVHTGIRLVKTEWSDCCLFSSTLQ
jgi:hypothetical protein